MLEALVVSLKDKIKPLLPAPLRQKLGKIYSGFRSRESVFTEIYQKNIWGGNSDTKGLYSGPGSRGLVAEMYVEKIREFILSNNISSVLDLGCGDFVIGKSIAEVSDHYTGVDVVKMVIDQHTRQFGSQKVQFLHMDIVKDELPTADLCLIRQVLQHLSNDHILQILPKLGKFRHVIITEHYPSPQKFVDYNLDIQHGSGTRLRHGSAVHFDKPPFNVKSSELLLNVPADGVMPETMDSGAGYIRSYLVRV